MRTLKLFVLVANFAVQTSEGSTLLFHLRIVCCLCNLHFIFNTIIRFKMINILVFKLQVWLMVAVVCISQVINHGPVISSSALIGWNILSILNAVIYTSIWGLAISTSRPNHTSHRKIYFNEFVLCDNIGMIIFDLQGCGDC